jgi:hypothetical protein
MLPDASGPLNIVEFSLWIVADVSDIYLTGDLVFGQEFSHDLFWQDDQLLTFEAFPFA